MNLYDLEEGKERSQLKKHHEIKLFEIQYMTQLNKPNTIKLSNFL